MCHMRTNLSAQSIEDERAWILVDSDGEEVPSSVVSFPLTIHCIFIVTHDTCDVIIYDLI